jgi:hypothetical protein
VDEHTYPSDKTSATAAVVAVAVSPRRPTGGPPAVVAARVMPAENG